MRRTVVLILSVAVNLRAACRQTDLGVGGLAIGTVIADAFLDAHNKRVVQALSLGVAHKQ